MVVGTIGRRIKEVEKIRRETDRQKKECLRREKKK